ncbi:hypothetical protein BDV27DRAFT_316 [Aspergillus caelatus]|uniref:Uncharacterized protein n=1 Tax=Aspergillus caelatus TaxID=61420 RepID=A0A5N7ALR6_9EURO|nr:uncharacterized protein BDV27DRAFT_316 [Aspergillus caelatus]KAE8370791.1 hypothetical protein BDV27DRAFT_316 [Aspergillus caelatus]
MPTNNRLKLLASQRSHKTSSIDGRGTLLVHPCKCELTSDGRKYYDEMGLNSVWSRTGTSVLCFAKLGQLFETPQIFQRRSRYELPVDESDLRVAAIGTTIPRSSGPFRPLSCRFSLLFSRLIICFFFFLPLLILLLLFL